MKFPPKHILLPIVIAIYALTMAWMNRSWVTVHHEYLKFYGTLAAEAVIIVALAIFLKKRAAIGNRSNKSR